jgi:voltage-gated sodium channel
MAESADPNLSALRRQVLALVDSKRFSDVIIGIIFINAVIFGLEASPALMATNGPLLQAGDRLTLAVFVIEIALRLFAHRSAFFRDPWSLFDLAVTAIALVPASGAFSVLRAMRVLRILRLVSAFPQLRRVIQGLLTAVPGLSSIAAILFLILYVFAVMAARLFGEQYPQWFGGLGTSLYTLFQVMTLEGWADIARDLQQTHPYAWIFFVIYILVSTFAVLNLFIAVMVDAMQRSEKSEEDFVHTQLAAIDRKIEALAGKIDCNARPPAPH